MSDARTKTVPLTTVSVTIFLYFKLETKKQFLQTMLAISGFHLEKAYETKPAIFHHFVML